MNELFNTSKTNWLELEADPAKTTNAAIEEHQKVMAQHFERAIAEARRLEDVKAKQMNQLAGLIGQGITVAKKYQKWKEFQDDSKAYDEGNKKGEEVEPDTIPKQPDKWGRDPDDRNHGIPPKQVEENKKKEAEEEKYLGELQETEIGMEKDRNTFVNSYINNEGQVTNRQVTAIAGSHIQDEIKSYNRSAARFTEENYSRFMIQAESEPILLKGMDRGPINGRWTIQSAAEAGRNDIVKRLKSHYRAVFLSLPQLENIPKRIKYRKVFPIMQDVDKKTRLAATAKLAENSVKDYITRRRQDLLGCVSGGDGLSCLVGTKKNPKSGHVFTNEGNLDGTKDNTKGWRIAIEDLDFLVKNGLLDDSDIAQIREGLISPRGGGKDVYMNQMSNLDYWDKQLANLEDEARKVKFKELAAKKKTGMASANDEAIAKLLQDKADGVKIDNEYMDNVLTQMEKTLQDSGIFVTKEELRSMDNSIDKYDTLEEMSDENITEHIDKLIKNNVSIPNSETMLVHIDDPELYKQYTKKVSEHKERLALVTTKDVKDFNSHILPSINKVLQVTQATTVKTVLKDNIIRNSEKLWKAKVLEYVDKHGIAGAKKLATDEILADMKDAVDEGRDLPDVYTEHVPYTIDTNLQLRTRATESFIKITPNALTIKEPWPIETPEVIQQGKDYLEGKAPPPLEYILMSNEYPDHTYHSLIETRVGVDPKKGEKGEGKVSESIESEELNNHTAFTGKGATPSTVHRAINSNDINQVLKIARKTDDVNSLLVGNMDSTLASPLERLGFDRPLSELSVDEIRGLVADESFHGLSDAKFGIFGIRGNQLKTILERESIDGDRLFDEDLQNELAIHNIRYKANQANSLSTTDSSNTRLTNISRGEQEEFLQIMGILSGDKDSENLKNTVEYQFLNSPFNQLDVLLPAVQTEVKQIDLSKSTGIDWKGVGWPFVGIYKGMDERAKEKEKQQQEDMKAYIERIEEQEEMFPTK